MSEHTEETSKNALVVVSNEYTCTPIGLAKNASSTSCNEDVAPRILSNELIVNPQQNSSLEKLDELSSLEQEIAKMHHVDDANMDLDGPSCVSNAKQKEEIQIGNALQLITCQSDMSNGENYPKINETLDTNVENKYDATNSSEAALGHEDLIAVLKGIDGNADEVPNNSGIASILEGVTIEGEGEYQIMEVIDDDSNAAEDPTKQDVNSASMVDPIVQNLNKMKTYGATALTVQEERALALEQMEGLKTAHRSRKQDIKPIKQVDPLLELVSTLEADWSEHEDNSESKSKQLTHKNKTVQSKISDKTIPPLITSVVVIPPAAAGGVSSTPMPAATTTAKQNINVGKNSSKFAETPVDGVVETKTEKDITAPSQSGFRRTRIIKRKIIWDPDAPETTFSYANLVKSNNNNKTKDDPMLATAIKKGSTTITPIKKETQNIAKKTQRPTTPKAKKSDFINEKTSSVKLESGNILKNIMEKEDTKPNKTEDIHASSSEGKSSPATTSPPKKRSQTPVSNGSGSGIGLKKKKITELDRLMGDEGAVNMLNSLEKLEATLGLSETKSTRPMMRSRAATICEKLPRKDTSPIQSTATTSPTGTNAQTNKGKRTPKSRASSSWDYVYKKKKKQDFDDSLIIRRRSNSSYSSTTSLNRSSLDGPPASIANNNASISSIKSNTSISLPASENENDSAKTTSSTSNHSKSSVNSKSRSTPTPPAGKTFEFAKPESKKSQKRTKSPAATLTNDMKKSVPVISKRNIRSPTTTTNEEKGKDSIKMPLTKSPNNIKDRKDTASSSSTTSDVVVKRSSKVAQIIFSTNKAKLSHTFTIQMLHKLVDILDKLAADIDCHVVVIGTSDDHFCKGVDVTDLTTIAAEKRKNYAVNLATSIKNYLKTLAKFPKPIIAGVNGNLMNLGVLQLALFDIVIASDKSTFETSYSKIGQTPEGYCLWHNMNKIRGSFKTKIFWLCEKVQSTEAALAGLVNKLTIANKVNDDAFMTAKKIASLSAESYRAMKQTVINSHLDVIANSLDEEFNTIIKQWTSNECLDNLKNYIANK